MTDRLRQILISSQKRLSFWQTDKKNIPLAKKKRKKYFFQLRMKNYITKSGEETNLFREEFKTGIIPPLLDDGATYGCYI